MVIKSNLSYDKICRFIFHKIKKKGSQIPMNQMHRTSTNPDNCLQSSEDIQQMNAFINEGYMRLKPLLYPCTIEFSLMCLTVSNSK